ncbi:MAG: hypothetical protein SFV15_07235 [Polyangiaceae bacterium]|nr:hypothetical protein [Polyangiaceae bacterium]
MNAKPSTTELLFQSLGRFRKAWPKGGWSWDGRLSCVASSFVVELTDEAQLAIRDVFVGQWSTKNIASAAQAVRDIADSTGGIRSDQVLYSTEPGGRLIAYGLWWPWGDDVTISMRVGLGGYVSDSDLTRFRELFGATED